MMMVVRDEECEIISRFTTIRSEWWCTTLRLCLEWEMMTIRMEDPCATVDAAGRVVYPSERFHSPRSPCRVGPWFGQYSRAKSWLSVLSANIINVVFPINGCWMLPVCRLPTDCVRVGGTDMPDVGRDAMEGALPVLRPCDKAWQRSFFVVVALQRDDYKPVIIVSNSH